MVKILGNIRLKAIIPLSGHWIPMIALVALGYVTSEQKNLAIGLLTLAVGINAATYLGFQVRKKKIKNLKRIY